MSDNRGILIKFAWGMEIIGVTGGILNSAYTTFGNELPHTVVGYIPALPLAALAVAELGRVPLASAVYHKRTFMRFVALLGIGALGYLAVENWTFGFERIVDLRLQPVNAASRLLSRSESELATLQQQRDRGSNGSSQKREELRRGVEQRDLSIAKLTAELANEANFHQQNLTQIRESCRLIRERCMVTRSHDEDERYKAAIGRLNDELIQQRHDRNVLQSQIEELTKADSASISSLDRDLASAAARVDEAKQALRIASDKSQIHRLAASWYGVKTSDVTDEQFANARLVFATFSAIAVAFAGSVAALVHYARDHAPEPQPGIRSAAAGLLRARRAYYARKRRPLVREVAGPVREVFRDGPPPPIVIEKEVPKFIDRIVLIPRFGIRFPVYINRLLGAEIAAEHTTASAHKPDASNVRPLNKMRG